MRRGFGFRRLPATPRYGS